ncbi:MAG TPA: dihydropyrimidinase [Candidatus Sumerlaeota bacterium]|nr:MAG: D-hydantoinase [candidate division BRC1 bacterium ADurb.Bin183]HOE64193.1 dihydropyrimidinase [Candidatus Sumerlaeota bacterium]HRR30490.1 dihydropyrimidinase [Candidatus Sumerlaeia bacterium]HON51021.1 dihydropyrimidinase [Candidatus Sumerlaeota bacterium]HOR65100.1 dihydropyrimidinase [Candidatus Sumerlaeota bacterium]
MKYDLIIRNGTLVTPTDMFHADIAIQGEHIASIGECIACGESPCEEINAQGKYVMPGGIDVHVHLQLPFCGTVSADDFVTGTRAAACGGVTTVIDYAMQDKENGLMAGIRNRMKEADGRVCVDYSLHGIITKWNDSIKNEMEEVIAFGIPTFKMFMIYESEGWQSDDAALFGALEATAENGSRICVHAESDKVMNVLIRRYLGQAAELGAWGHVLSRPNFIEAEAVQRAITWAGATGGRLYIVHMSTGEAAEILHQGRHSGVNVYAETCPQYLLLTDEVFKDKERGHLYATCPQIKKKADQERLWRGLVEQDLSIVSTDTCTFNTQQKAMWKGNFSKIPYGLPGVETLLPSVYTYGVLQKRFDLNYFVSLISANPAKLMGLYPQKGTLAIGSDADIIIVDPRKTRFVDYKDLQTNCDWSPYQGMEMAGFPDITICRGKPIVREGKFIGKEGYGKFIKRRPGGEI